MTDSKYEPTLQSDISKTNEWVTSQVGYPNYVAFVEFTLGAEPSSASLQRTLFGPASVGACSSFKRRLTDEYRNYREENPDVPVQMRVRVLHLADPLFTERTVETVMNTARSWAEELEKKAPPSTIGKTVATLTKETA